MLRELVIGIALLSLVFTSACIDSWQEERSEQYMQICLDLTSYDAPSIPECTTVQKCFKQVEKSFFRFPEEPLSLQTRNILQHYKNHIAKAWLHYNNALEYLEDIRGACTKKDFDRALALIDDFKYEIERAFEESDSAASASFGIILREKELLEKQDINMVREEPLYATYIKLSDNARQIFSERYLGLDNYASNYWRLSEDIRMMRIFTNKEPKLIRKRFPMELFSRFLLYNIAYANSHDAVFVPVLSIAIAKYIDIVEESETVSELFASLGKERPDFFLRLFSDVVGPKHSLASEFVKLIKEDAINRAFLNSELESLKKILEEKISEAEQSAEFFKSDVLSYADENFMLHLQALLNEPLSVSFDTLAFTSLADASKRAEVEIAAVRSEFSVLKTDIDSDRATIGSAASRLKQLNLRIEYIAGSLDRLKGSFYVLLDRCNKEILSSGFEVPELILLKEKYINASAEKKLGYCSEFVERKSLLKQNRLKMQENSARLKETTCYEKLRVLIRFVDSESLIQRYNRLLDTNNVLHECNAILSAVQAHIREHYNIAEIEELFGEVEEYNAYLERFTGKRNKRFYELSVFFRSGRLVLEKAMPNINTLRWSIKKLHGYMVQETASFLSSYIEQHYSLKAFPLSGLELSNADTQKQVAMRLILSFDNPLFEFGHALSVKLPVASSTCTIVSKSPNISAILFSEDALTLNLEYLPKGPSSVELSCSKTVMLKKLAQHTTISSLFGIVSESYRFVSDTAVSRIKLRFSGVSHANASIVFRNKAYPLVFADGFFTATLEDIAPNEEFSVNYLISEPLKIKLKLLSKKKQGNTLIFTYLCTIKNTTAFEARKAFVMVPLVSDGEGLTIFDEQGRKLSHSIEPIGIKVVLDRISPYSERMLYIKLEVEDINAFKDAVAKEIEEIVQELKESEHFSKDAEKLLRVLNRNRSASIESLQELYEDALDIREKYNKHRMLFDQYSVLKSTLQNAVSDLNAELALASSLGLSSLKEALSERLKDATFAMLKAESYLSNDIEQAIAALESALNDIREPYGYAEEHIREKALRLAKETNNISKLFRSTGLSDANSMRMIDAANKYYGSILDNLSKARIGRAVQALNALERALSDLNRYFHSLVEKHAEMLVEKIDSIFNISKTYEAKIDFLKEQLDSVPKKLLIEARYNPDFDESVLDTLSSRLSLSKEPIWEELAVLLNSNNPIDALRLANEKSVHRKLSKIEDAYRELLNLESSLKKGAEYYVEMLEKQASKDKTIKSIASKARERFLGKRYMEALAMAKAALLTLNNGGPEIQLYWLVFVALLALSILIAKNKSNKKQIKRFQRVLRNINYV